MQNTRLEETLTLTVNDLSRGGAGVAKDASGRVIFIPHSAPGDIVEVQITHTEKNYADAKIINILQASPQRVEAPCEVFGKCGGCEWQHISYEQQWRTKTAGVKHALKRTGTEYTGEWDELPATQIWNYRNRIQLRGFKNEIGFFARSSKELIAIQDCKIARKELNEKIPQLLEEGKNLSRPYKVEIEVLENGEVRSTWNQGHAAQGFRQIHDEQNEKLKNWVQEKILGAQKHTRANMLYDLYGGWGNLSLGLAKNFEKIFCVDLSSPEKNPPPTTPTNFSYFQSSVAQWLSKQVSITNNALAILDPPRDGLSTEHVEILQSLDRLACKTIVLVGCDADSWARDLARLQRKQWKVEKLGTLDLFPQTHHIESLAVLTKN